MLHISQAPARRDSPAWSRIASLSEAPLARIAHFPIGDVGTSTGQETFDDLKRLVGGCVRPNPTNRSPLSGKALSNPRLGEPGCERGKKIPQHLSRPSAAGNPLSFLEGGRQGIV